MARGSRFSSVLTWFRNADPDEVRAIMPLVIEACGTRRILIDGTRPQTKQRKPRATKAEMVQRRLNGTDRSAAAQFGAAQAAGAAS